MKNYAWDLLKTDYSEGLKRNCKSWECYIKRTLRIFSTPESKNSLIVRRLHHIYDSPISTFGLFQKLFLQFHCHHWREGSFSSLIIQCLGGRAIKIGIGDERLIIETLT